VVTNPRQSVPRTVQLCRGSGTECRGSANSVAISRQRSGVRGLVIPRPGGGVSRVQDNSSQNLSLAN
ncbi:unnamed protein product, partial [Nesidiocoris tenuis]